MPAKLIPAASGDVEPNDNRTHLAFFAGKIDSEVRKELYKKHGSDGGLIYLPTQLAPADYSCAMASSVFCLAPRGNAAWSPRLDEAIAAGCIPVILADAYEPPFHHVLDYESFSVAVPEANVATLPALLAGISAERRRVLEKHAKRRDEAERALYRLLIVRFSGEQLQRQGLDMVRAVAGTWTCR